jgi:hypothetical protein
VILDLSSYFIARDAFRYPLTAYPHMRNRRDNDDASPAAMRPALGPQHMRTLCTSVTVRHASVIAVMLVPGSGSRGTGLVCQCSLHPPTANAAQEARS